MENFKNYRPQQEPLKNKDKFIEQHLHKTIENIIEPDYVDSKRGEQTQGDLEVLDAEQLIKKEQARKELDDLEAERLQKKENREKELDTHTHNKT